MRTRAIAPGVDIPVLGFGVYQTSPARTERVVREAIESSTDGLLKLRWEKDRVLPASRRHINQKWASLRREQIRVYERIR